MTFQEEDLKVIVYLLGDPSVHVKRETSEKVFPSICYSQGLLV
jgi:hypothetical protein